ncbi:ODR-3 protein [Aphelenchoides avenae]|nr:ODR-3 protein [Aphelenchus avenae]
MGNCTQRLWCDPSAVRKDKVTDISIRVPSLPVKMPASPPSCPKAISRKIDEQLEQEKRAQEKTMKLLLLGPGESGKTTLLKQMKIIHLNGYSEKELMAHRPIIYQNAVESTLQLLNGIDKLGLSLPANVATHVLSLRKLAQVTIQTMEEPIFRSLKLLWQLEAVQKAYERRSEFQLLDCAKYFLDDLDRIYRPNFCPTVKDVLSARAVTFGVNEMSYRYGEREFRIVDVGGQRSERRKWISIFDNVSAVFFIAAISEFDQCMLEDDTTNRLTDAIKLFADIGNNALFIRAHMILFLNKKDLFEEKIKRVRMSHFFPDYKYKNDYKNATTYVAKVFEKQILNPDKNVYIHLTCAKDTSQMQFLTKTVSDMVLSAAVRKAGTL